MRTYWNRLGRSDAISLVTLIVVVLVQTSGSFITSLVDYTGRVPEFLLVRTAASSAMFMVLGLGKLVISRPLKPELKPFVTVITFFLASLTAVLVDDTLLQVTQFTSESRFFNRLGLSIVGLPTAMIVTAFIVTGLREYTAENQKLIETAKLLLNTRNEAKNRIATRKAELFKRINREITLSIEGINYENSDVTQQEMKSLLDDVVRPLSFELERDRKLEEVNIVDIPRPKINWPTVLASSINHGNPFHPIAAAAWPTLTSTAFLIANFGPIGFVVGLVFFVIYSSCTFFARKLWGVLSLRVPSAIRAILIFLLFALISWAGSFALILPASGTLVTGGKIYFWIIFTEVVAWTVALLFTANQLLSSTKAALTDTNEDLKREIISLNASLRQLQRGISRVLHGPVQQAITSSIYRLQSSANIASNKKVIDEVRQRIRDSLVQLQEPSNTFRDLGKSLADLAELWSGIAAITVDVDAEDMQIIQNDPQATYAVWELISEASVNAIKHSEPSHIAFTIKVKEAKRQIVIHKTSDGKPISKSSKPGLGTQLLDEMCLYWKREQKGNLLVLEMIIPLYEK